jgi:glucose/mannose transport system permease protein
MWMLPTSFSLESFFRAWNGENTPNGATAGYAMNFLNSIYLALPGTPISSVLGSINGPILSKWKSRGADVIFPLAIVRNVHSVPKRFDSTQPGLQALKLYGMIPGLIFVHVVYGIPITTLLFRNYYATIPNDLLESAKIDGAGLLGIYRYILAPGFVFVLIWQFNSIWNEFLFTVLLTNKPSV